MQMNTLQGEGSYSWEEAQKCRMKQSCKEEIGWWIKEKYVQIERIVITSCEI